MAERVSLVTSIAPLNLAEKVALQENLNNSYFIPATPDTIALITLANAMPVAEDSLIYVSLNHDWRLVKKRPSEVLKELEQGALHTQAEKEKIVAVYFEKGYRFPVISGQLLFVPFDGPCKKETDWYNILLIEAIKPAYDKETGITDTLLVFKGGQEIILPRRPQSVVTKVKESLHRSHFYFKLYDLILVADQQAPSPSLLLIEEKLRQLSLDSYPWPGEEVIQEGLKTFKKAGIQHFPYEEVAEEVGIYKNRT